MATCHFLLSLPTAQYSIAGAVLRHNNGSEKSQHFPYKFACSNKFDAFFYPFYF